MAGRYDDKTDGHETLKMKNHFGGEDDEEEKGTTWPQFVAAIAGNISLCSGQEMIPRMHFYVARGFNALIPRRTFEITIMGNNQAERDLESVQEAIEYPSQTAATFLSVPVQANISAMISGCIIGWTSPSLPKLEGGSVGFQITKEENSWISSLMPLAACLGPFVAGYMADKYGRKKTLITSALPALISWICLAAGRSVALIYAARFVAGFAVGWIFTVLPMYCGEIAGDSVRGAIGSLMQVFICIGLLFDYVVGPYVSYTMLSVLGGAFPLLFALAFYWMPESPYFLLGNNNFEAAKKSLKWLRNKSEDGIGQELKSIHADVESSKAQTGTFKDLVATKGTTKALVLSLGLVGFQQFSGINAVLFNAEPIFRRAGGSIEPEVSTIIVGAVMLAASAATPFVVDRLGRRILLLMSAAGMGIAQGVLGLYFYLDSTGTDTSSYSYLPVIAMLVYIIVYSTGFGPLPWAIMGEMFPPNIKSLASTLTASFAWFLGFIVTRFFNDLLDLMDSHFTFWLFGIFCFGAIFFVSFLLPETKGKSLVEIQEMLNS